MNDRKSKKTVKRALLAIDYPQNEMNEMIRLLGAEELVCCPASQLETVRTELGRAEVAILGRPPVDCASYVGPGLRWIHCDAAGVDSFYTPGLASLSGLAVTGASGRSSGALAEHVLMFMLALNYHLNEVWETRQMACWVMPFLNGARSFLGQTAGILGTGSIARELAPRLKMLGMRVIGFARNGKNIPGFDDLYYGNDGLETVLRESDVIVSALPLTDKTFHLLNGERLRLIRPTAFLINISRGAVVDEMALIACLEEGKLAGVGLDTFEQEPLPADSPLWKMEQVILTPHRTLPQPDKHEISLRVILDNIRAYKEGRELSNLCRPEDGFSGYVQ